MHDLEAAANDAAALEQPVDLLRSGIGDHVEILGLPPAQQIPQAPSDQIGFEPGLMQSVEYIECGPGHLFTGNRVGVAGNHLGLGKAGRAWGTKLNKAGQFLQKL